MAKFSDRLAHAWNAFMNKDPTVNYYDFGQGSTRNPDKVLLARGGEKTVVTAIYNRIAIDVAALTIKHVILDEDGRYLKDANSSLNDCLCLEANKDQTSRSFIQDYVYSMFDEGCVAAVPYMTNFDPLVNESYDIRGMRIAKILQWYPNHIQVRIYNDITGQKEDRTYPKRVCAILENPFYAVVNESNSVGKRLINKLNLIDQIGEQAGSGKLDLIIQLPYVIKTEARKAQAEQRRKDIEAQLAGSKYGIAYTDGTERITQLNRSLENNLLKEAEYLTDMLYAQLGIDASILNNTADEKTLLNYQNKVIEPIVSAICLEFTRKFLTKTARTKGHAIKYFLDPFKMVPVSQIAEIADKMTRNEILTTNEVRQIVGIKPSSDPNADELRNKNLNQSAEAMAEEQTGDPKIGEEAALNAITNADNK